MHFHSSEILMKVVIMKSIGTVFPSIYTSLFSPHLALLDLTIFVVVLRFATVVEGKVFGRF